MTEKTLLRDLMLEAHKTIDKNKFKYVWMIKLFNKYKEMNDNYIRKLKFVYIFKIQFRIFHF
jgi:hypothetical protein